MAFAAIRSRLRRRHFGWLLALALWLPVAQWAAATHALLHLQASGMATQGQQDPAPHLPGSCELCVVAAALGGVAPGPAVQAPVLATAPHAAPMSLPTAQRPAAPPRFYASRAPPLPHA